jgi:tRNA modification GTPase
MPGFMDSDTIAAISTPAGEAGIGIVRLSGPGAVGIANEIFQSPKGKKPSTSHRVLYGLIRDPESGADVDEVLLTVMRAPHTYTREDVVEINCHGGMVPMKRVLELALRYGARLAEPGEFTKRAFLNGRIDLSQAEAALDLIRAKTEAAEKIALEQLRGALSDEVNSLREKLIDVCANVEAHLDFPEEEIEPRTLEEIKKEISGAGKRISALSESFNKGRFFREGLKTAIVGRPNVGKSSLLNALLGSERAIVTEAPGTTRDTIEEHLNINGLPLRVVDTAGIREAHGMAEKEGVRRSLQALEDADLVLGVLDGSAPLHEEDHELLEKLRDKNSIIVVNKKDLGTVESISDSEFGVRSKIALSARTGDGLDELKRTIYESALASGGSGTEGVVVTNLRHKLSLDAAGEGLRNALASLNRNPLEITAVELRASLDSLGEIVGEVTTEDILNRIFENFCIGK